MNRLMGIVPEEISFVRKPAIRRVFLLTKSAEAEEEATMPEEKKEGQGKGFSLVFKADGAPDWDSVPVELRPSIEAAFQMGAKQSEETVRKAVDEAVAKAADLEKRLAEERDVRITKEFVEKASADFGNLPLAAAELGPVIKEISEKAPDAWTKLEPVLKGASTAIGEGEIFREIGSGRTNPIPAGSAWAEIEKRAATLIEKGSERLSKEQAIDRVLEQEPQLYARYERERQALLKN